MNRLLRSWLWLGLLVAGAVALPWLVAERDGPLLPASLGTLPLHRSIAGMEAAAVVDRMHGHAVAEAQNAIGVYRSARGSAMLYVTRYDDAAGANDGERRMGEKIATGEYVFQKFRRGFVDGKAIAACSGLGQEHFIFSHRRTLYWLAVDPPLAEEVVRSLIAGLP